MAGKREKPEDIVTKLRQIEVLQGQGMNVADPVRRIGVTQQTYYRWRRQYGGMSRDQLKRLGLRKELHFYDARGSACTRLILAGASLGEIAAVMGWGTKTAASMIEVYATLDPRLADSVLVKLEQVRAAQS